MKHLFLSLFTMCVVMACSSSDSEDVPSISANNDSDIELLDNEAQKNFIKDVNIINKEYQTLESRSYEDAIANGSKWALVAIADGCGGVIGAGYLSWFTGAAVSTLYENYLDNILEQSSRASISKEKKYVDVTQNGKYNKLNTIVAFQFCNNTPKNAQDSIGYMHNKLLNKLMTYNDNYISKDNNIDYKAFFSDYKKCAKDLGYPSEHAEAISNQDFYNSCNNIVKSLAKLQVGKITIDEAFNAIESSLHYNAKLNKGDAKFISVLAKSIAVSLLKDIQIEDISSYSTKLSNALERSKLSEDNLSTCKKMLQTIVCSSIYWSTQENKK